MGRKKGEYAYYKGDELIMIGTRDEIAERLGVTKAYVSWVSTLSRNPEKYADVLKGRKTLFVRVEDKDEY